MFISKSNYNALVSRIEQLEEYAHNDYVRAEKTAKKLKSLKKTVLGEETQYEGLYTMLTVFPGLRNESRPQLSITEKIDQIIEHVGLEAKYTREAVRLVKKPEPAKRKAKK